MESFSCVIDIQFGISNCWFPDDGCCFEFIYFFSSSRGWWVSINALFFHIGISGALLKYITLDLKFNIQRLRLFLLLHKGHWKKLSISRILVALSNTCHAVQSCAILKISFGWNSQCWYYMHWIKMHTNNISEFLKPVDCKLHFFRKYF